MSLQLVTDVHTEINKIFPTNSYFVRGTYEYYHYLCDGFDDRGWGCGYRTLQTICSWMNHNFNSAQNVPSVREIQEILVGLEDKPESFLGSRQWIGSFEVCLVLDKLFDVPSKIIHVNKGDALENIVKSICNHFEKFGSPIMMGGDIDCSSKGVMGVHADGVNSKLLIVTTYWNTVSWRHDFLYSVVTNHGRSILSDQTIYRHTKRNLEIIKSPWVGDWLRWLRRSSNNNMRHGSTLCGQGSIKGIPAPQRLGQMAIIARLPKHIILQSLLTASKTAV